MANRTNNMTFSAMTYSGNSWINVKVIEGATNCNTIGECIEKAVKSAEYTPNLCIWIVLDNDPSDKCLHTVYSHVHWVQHMEKSHFLQQMFGERCNSIRENTYYNNEMFWRTRQELIDTVEVSDVLQIYNDWSQFYYNMPALECI